MESSSPQYNDSMIIYCPMCLSDGKDHHGAPMNWKHIPGTFSFVYYCINQGCDFNQTIDIGEASETV